MILKLKPIFFEKIWGGDNLKKIYQYECSNKTGEVWGISGHLKNSSIIKNGIYKNKSLSELYLTKRELFGNCPYDKFPILVKIIDAKQDLSIQVHPNNEYAKIYENSYGKSEAWYILDTYGNTEIIIGHTMKSANEVRRIIDQNIIETKLNKFSINKGDFFYIESGTIHAICAGTMLLEVQQSSDVTYRVYDYNRLENGKPRELATEKSKHVITAPFKGVKKNRENPFFIFEIYEQTEETSHISHLYGDYIVILKGSGLIDNIKVKPGDFIVITTNHKYTIFGKIVYQKTVIK